MVNALEVASCLSFSHRKLLNLSPAQFGSRVGNAADESHGRDGRFVDPSSRHHDRFSVLRARLDPHLALGFRALDESLVVEAARDETSVDNGDDIRNQQYHLAADVDVH